MRAKLWTARVTLRWCAIAAQHKGSRLELLRRLRLDDPCWVALSLTYEPRFTRSKFNRGLAIVAEPI